MLRLTVRVLWISGRVMGEDLAGTTEFNLASNLEMGGVMTTLISPGIVSSEKFNHIEINRMEFPGLKTLSGARKIRKIMKNNSELVANSDLVLVDWRFVSSLRNQLKRMPTMWAIIDRGPPATSGIRGGRIQRELLRNIQKRFWKNAWRIAAHSSCGGFVVSSRHEKLVNSMIGKNLRLFVLPAGTEPNRYLREKPDPSIKLKLAYVGRIDKKRGLGDVFSLSEVLEDKGICHSIVLVGEGDMAEEFYNRSQKDTKFSFLGKMKQNKVQRVLAEQHVGIMPMPDIAIWRISSPIKLAEYAASGLAIVGPSHPGNQLEDGGEWNLLSEDGDWAQTCATALAEIIHDGGWMERISNGAQQASLKYHWDVIAKRMTEDILEITQYS